LREYAHTTDRLEIVISFHKSLEFDNIVLVTPISNKKVYYRKLDKYVVEFCENGRNYFIPLNHIETHGVDPSQGMRSYGRRALLDDRASRQ
jgi:hypothetical protein